MKLIVSLHDVHPSSLTAVAQQRAELRARGVRRFSLLVVPRWHGRESIESDAEFVKTLSRWQNEGDEIVLHGWTHSCSGMQERSRDWFWTRLYTSQEAEFYLANPDETRIRLTTGRDLFDRLGWSPVGFIAPAWLMAPHTVPILREMGFAYTVTRQQVLPLADTARPIISTSLCYSTRSPWRRTASRFWNPSLARQLRQAPLLRISLHPGDVVYSRVWHQVCRLTENALKAGRISQTYRDCATTQPELQPHPLTSGAPRAA